MTIVETDTDTLILTIAEELGASASARKKWRQRGVPYRQREEIRERAAALGVKLSRDDFERFPRDKTSAGVAA